MLFEVKDGARRLCWTEHRAAIPSKTVRRQLRAAGYKIYLDGKPFQENQPLNRAVR